MRSQRRVQGLCILAAVLALLGPAGCADREATAPDAQRPAAGLAATAVAPPASTLEDDCALLHLNLKGKTAQASVDSNPTCAGRVTAAVSAVSQAAGRDRGGSQLKSLRISVVLNNASVTPALREPVYVVLDLAGMTVLSPPGLGNNPHALVDAPSADGLTPASDALPGAAYWSWDGLLDQGQADPAGRLEPGEQSAPRTLELRVQAGVQELTLPLHVRYARVPELSCSRPVLNPPGRLYTNYAYYREQSTHVYAPVYDGLPPVDRVVFKWYDPQDVLIEDTNPQMVNGGVAVSGLTTGHPSSQGRLSTNPVGQWHVIACYMDANLVTRIVDEIAFNIY